MKKGMKMSIYSQIMLLVSTDLRPILQASICQKSVLSERKSIGQSMQTILSSSTLSTFPIRTSRIQTSILSKNLSHGSATTFTTWIIVCEGHILWPQVTLAQSCTSMANRYSSVNSHKMQLRMKYLNNQVASTRIYQTQRNTESILARCADLRTHLKSPTNLSSSSSLSMAIDRCLRCGSPR